METLATLFKILEILWLWQRALSGWGGHGDHAMAVHIAKEDSDETNWHPFWMSLTVTSQKSLTAIVHRSSTAIDRKGKSRVLLFRLAYPSTLRKSLWSLRLSSDPLISFCISCTDLWPVNKTRNQLTNQSIHRSIQFLSRVTRSQVDCFYWAQTVDLLYHMYWKRMGGGCRGMHDIYVFIKESVL